MNGNDWRLIYTRPLAERLVLDALDDLKVDAYAPQEQVWRGTGHRRRVHIRPLLSRILFAKVHADMLPEVTHLDGVAKLIIPAKRDGLKLLDFMSALRASEEAGLYDHTTSKPRRKLKAGDSGWIARGKWAGISVTIADMTNTRRVQLVTNLFGRRGQMTMDLVALEAVLEDVKAAA